jgi:ATP-dependent helicase YprA (DUF1998 family)
MTKAKPFYASLAEQLNRRATRAVLGLLGFRNDALRGHLRERFGQDPGMPGSFLADPVFEATFGWQPASPSLADLAGSLLHPEVLRALAEPPQALRKDYAFPSTVHPYLHQLEAWRALIEAQPPRSVLVSSGTGSGKTECFLVPILNDLAAEIERRHGAPLTGVRAVFLYPLNALIKSQKDRLVAWSEPFGGRVRFCLYNGDTPEQGKSEWDSEVADRRTLRANPPPILVTNATMLEYLLVRNEDRPILAQSQGSLRWIVIDEAHTYIGSQAAELTLLLRRVLHAFGVDSGQVHFVATSATLGESSETARRHLAEFLADVAGVAPERVSVIEGCRQVSELPESLRLANAPHPAVDALRSLTPAQRFAALGGDRRIRDLRQQIIEQPRPLVELARTLYQREDAESRRKTLDLLDVCTQAVNASQEPLLPLRGHFFQRTLNGLWACANPGCDGRTHSRLDDARWPFGAVYLERRLHCEHCQYPVFELVLCGECGAEYLAAAEVFKDGKDWLEPWTQAENEDEFQQELEPPEPDQEEEDAGERHPAPKQEKHPRLLTTAALATVPNFRLLQGGQLESAGSEGAPVHYRQSLRDAEGIRCPVCSESEKPGRPFTVFKPVRVGAPFLLGTAIPALLNHVKPFDRDLEPRPLEGRRLITFTDSRQGTARFAAKLQQESERDYVRSLLYHHVAGATSAAGAEDIENTQKEIADLEKAVLGYPALRTVLEEKQKKLSSLLAPPMGCLPWEDAADKLLRESDFKDWLLPGLRELTFGQLLDRPLARLCLLREFFLRPKRQFSLEGLGLLQLAYPALDPVVLPAVFRQRGLADNEWQELLRVAVDFHIRGGKSVSITPDTVRWLGYPGHPTAQLPPGQPKTKKNQRPWPSARSPQASRNRLVRLLAFAFELGLDASDHCDKLDEMLIAIWQGIRPLLSQTEDGFLLELEKQAVITEVREAWFCPVMRRLLPTTFRDITPYLPNTSPESLALCRKFTLPRVPHPFWFGCEREKVENWLETDPAILQLREIGAWSDISDRIASHSRYLRAVEHSAQIAGAELTRREDAFKQGKINLMSCSTTMEMGVDIGGLTGVAMNNVPPHPANFLQRAGRAGRRGETAALSFTLCKATPHGEAVFRNPLWPFTTRLPMPQVALHSAPIVQRHVNALALAGFLRERAPERIRKLNTGWFFEAAGEGESAPCERFAEWCQDGANRTGSLTEGVQALIRRSVLDGTAPTELLIRVAESAEQAAERWRRELRALLEQQDAVKTQDGDSKAEVAIKIQLDRLRGEYLLGELATLGFLPGYGFPTDVVPFVITTLEDVERRQRQDRKEREDNRTWRAGYPSRNLAIAIRDYAPGTDTVLDQRVYRSEGVTLNWHLPAAAEGAPEIQSLRHVWQCRACGSSGTRAVRPTSCPHCGETDGNKLVHRRFLQPAGFAVDLRCKPHNDVSTPQYIPVREPLISLDGAEWMALATVGRFRASNEGHIFHYSDGLHGNGYGLCLRCGRADSMTQEGERPASLDGHKRLRGGKLNDREKACPGNDEDWAVQEGLLLGVVSWTDVLELQLRNPTDGKPINDKATAYTLAVALRRALCLSLGIEESEVGCATLPGRDAEEQPTLSIFLYDTASGGAGYATQARSLLPALFQKARERVLECPLGCDSACQGCVLSYDTQHHLEHLNRHAALALLSSAFLEALELPNYLKVFGTGSQLEMEPLSIALRREWQRQPGTDVRVYLGGQPETWEPLAWRLRGDLMRLSECGAHIRLLLPTSIMACLADSQRDELAALAAVAQAELCGLSEDSVAVGASKLPLVLEIGGPVHRVRWAASHPVAPSSAWGNGAEGVRYVIVRESMALSGLEYPAIAPESLRPKPIVGITELRILCEFDGASIEFGRQAWNFIRQQTPALDRRLKDASPLCEICYTDRYLRSPLVMHLLRELLDVLQEYSGGINSNTRVEIRTGELDCRDERLPCLVQHDWRDAGDRRSVAEQLFGGFTGFTWQEARRRDLPHARELRLTWPDGENWFIRLDQGFGYWEPTSRLRIPFPFDKEPARQSDFLKKINLVIRAVGGGHPTYWYCTNGILRLD